MVGVASILVQVGLKTNKANIRLYNHILNKSVDAADPTLLDLLICQNHQCNIIEASIVGTTDASLVSSFFSFSHFLQAATHFTKLKHALRQFIEESATIATARTEEECRPSGNDSCFVEELLDLVLQIKRCLHHVHDKQSEQANFEEPDFSQYAKKMKFFASMWNQNLASPNMGHTCHRPSCCKDDTDAKDKLYNSIVAIGLASVPDTPAPGKWTKMWSMISFHGKLYSLC